MQNGRVMYDVDTFCWCVWSVAQWVQLDMLPTPFFFVVVVGGGFFEVSDICPLLDEKMAFQLFSQKNKAPSCSLVVKLVIHNLAKYYNHHSAE